MTSDDISPEREKGDELCPLAAPFSLLLSEEDELGLDVDALLENCRVLQSETERRGKVEAAEHSGVEVKSWRESRGGSYLSSR